MSNMRRIYCLLHAKLIMHSEDSLFIQRCLQIAQSGLGNVAPNPMVGSVIVSEGKIVCEGFHRQFGGAHAEVNAIEALPEGVLPENCTLYVNLEPCSHHGKTPPCADLIIRKGFRKVVIGTLDPNPLVAGRGIEKLRQAGIEVVSGVEEEACRWLNRRFFTWHLKKQPFVILKWAQTKNGMIDKRRKPGEMGINWISSAATKRLVHRWRSEEQAILIGANTLHNDNPSLTVREVSGKNPLRIVLAGRRDIPEGSWVLDDTARTIFFHTGEGLRTYSDTHQHFISPVHESLQNILEMLFQHQIQSIIVEGGKQILESFIHKDLWDEARIITGIDEFDDGVSAPEISGKTIELFISGGDTIQILHRT